MKYFAVVAFLTATAVNALIVEDDCCEVPTGTSCPSDYPVALTTTAEAREALSLSGVACCASDAQASEFGKDPLVACPAVVETTSDGDEDATVTTTAAGGPVTISDTCCSTADKTCPDGKVLLEDVDTNVEGTQVHACCVSDGDFNLSDMSLEPCPATADVQITSAGGDEATTTTTTSSGSGAGECCKSTTACPSDKTQTDTLDAMSQVVNVCCGEGGDASGIPIDWLAVCGEDGAPVQVQADDGTTTTAASSCCHTAETTCPEDLVDTDIDTMIEGTMVQVCCAPDGNGISNLATTPSCSLDTADTEEVDAGESAAPKGSLVIAATVVLIAAALQ